MELRITNYIVISTVNYADGESDNDGEKMNGRCLYQWKTFLLANMACFQD